MLKFSRRVGSSSPDDDISSCDPSAHARRSGGKRKSMHLVDMYSFQLSTNGALTSRPFRCSPMLGPEQVSSSYAGLLPGWRPACAAGCSTVLPCAAHPKRLSQLGPFREPKTLRNFFRTRFPEFHQQTDTGLIVGDDSFAWSTKYSSHCCLMCSLLLRGARRVRPAILRRGVVG